MRPLGKSAIKAIEERDYRHAQTVTTHSQLPAVNWPADKGGQPERASRFRPRLPGRRLLLMLLLVLLFGTSGDNPLTQVERIQARGTLVMLTVNGATTYFLGPQGETGYEYDLPARFPTTSGCRWKWSPCRPSMTWLMPFSTVTVILSPQTCHGRRCASRICASAPRMSRFHRLSSIVGAIAAPKAWTISSAAGWAFSKAPATS